MRLRPRKEAFHYSLGQSGESLVWEFLLKRGYAIIEKNFRCPLGEIDIIAKKNRSIRFVEVKTRSSEKFGRPEEAVTKTKQSKIIKVAQWYLKTQKLSDVSAGFDVVAVAWAPGASPEIRMVENAFGLEDSQGLV